MTSTRGAVSDRVHETEDGLQGEEIADKYDEMQRHIRDNGWLQEKVVNVLEAGITSGRALELGCGPGYLGLEWLRQVPDRASLVGLDISPAMLARAASNADAYGVASLCSYEIGDIHQLPFAAADVDHVFSTSSLHEWADPVRAFNEIHRVLRVGGRFCVTDLRRDLDRVTFQFMKANIAPDMRPGFRTSVNSAYTKNEIEALLGNTALVGARVDEVQMGLVITGGKEAQ